MQPAPPAAELATLNFQNASLAQLAVANPCATAESFAVVAHAEWTPLRISGRPAEARFLFERQSGKTSKAAEPSTDAFLLSH